MWWRKWLVRLACGLVLLAAVASIAVPLWLDGRWPRVSDVLPLDLASPGGWLVDRQLAELGDDPALCRQVLASPQISGRPVADQSSKPGCGWVNAVELTHAGGARLSVNPMTCEQAAALALWMTHVVQPHAAALPGSRVVAVEHVGGFACRNIRGSPAFVHQPSQHASANALDITGFRLADGRRIRVLADWGKDTPGARFLAAILKDGCRYFRVAIGPDYNAAHRDHFHLDRGRWRACR